jgi:hypothetical protein
MEETEKGESVLCKMHKKDVGYLLTHQDGKYSLAISGPVREYSHRVLHNWSKTHWQDKQHKMDVAKTLCKDIDPLLPKDLEWRFNGTLDIQYPNYERGPDESPFDVRDKHNTCLEDYVKRHDQAKRWAALGIGLGAGIAVNLLFGIEGAQLAGLVAYASVPETNIHDTRYQKLLMKGAWGF